MDAAEGAGPTGWHAFTLHVDPPGEGRESWCLSVQCPCGQDHQFYIAARGTFTVPEETGPRLRSWLAVHQTHERRAQDEREAALVWLDRLTEAWEYFTEELREARDGATAALEGRIYRPEDDDA